MKVNENLQFRALTCGPLSSNGVFTEQPVIYFNILLNKMKYLWGYKL